MKKNIQKLALLAIVLLTALAQPLIAQQAPAKKPTPAASAKPSEEKMANKDKEVGKDEKGRTIYEGPKGGRYYMNKEGKKVYIKKAADAAAPKTTPAKTATPATK